MPSARDGGERGLSNRVPPVPLSFPCSLVSFRMFSLAHLYEKIISREICVRRSAISSDLDRKISGKLLVIWDGAPIHRAQAIKDFLKRGAGKHLHLERL